MKKTRLYSLLAIVLAVSLLSSCTHDDDSSCSSVSPTLARGIAVSVSDGQFEPLGGTRAIPDGLETVFEQGDAIGVFAVDAEGKVVRSNVKYVCNGVNWNVDDDATVPIQFDSDYSYFAYYPYQADLTTLAPGVAEDEMLTAEAIATSDAFFEEMIGNWEVKDNQKAKADYVASDLMVAKGTHAPGAGDYSIDFELFHQMGLVMLSFGEITRMVDASITWKEPITQTCKGETQPYVWEGIGRYIVNPASATPKLLTASDDTWKQAVRVSQRGRYREYKMEATIGYTLAVGDIAWSDGSFSKTLDYNRFYDKRPIGIVAHLGSDQVTGLDKNDDDELLYTHGIIMATSPVTNKMYKANSVSVASLAGASEHFISCNRYCLAAMDFDGLNKTEYLRTLDGDGYLAAKVRAYGRKAPTTFRNSDWYIGSAGQWCQLVADLGGNAGDFLTNWKTTNTGLLGFNQRVVQTSNYTTFWAKPAVTADYYTYGGLYITTSSVGGGGNFVTFCWYNDNNKQIYLDVIANETAGWTYPILSF